MVRETLESHSNRKAEGDDAAMELGTGQGWVPRPKGVFWQTGIGFN